MAASNHTSLAISAATDGRAKAQMDIWREDLQLGEPATQKAALRVGWRKLQRALVGELCLRCSLEAAEQIGAGRGQQVVVMERAVALQFLNEREADLRAVRHRDRNRAVQHHDRRRGHLTEPLIEQ